MWLTRSLHMVYLLLRISIAFSWTSYSTACMLFLLTSNLQSVLCAIHYMHIQTHTTHVDTHARTRARAHTTCVHEHAHTHACMHTNTHKHARTHAHYLTFTAAQNSYKLHIKQSYYHAYTYLLVGFTTTWLVSR